MPRRTYQDGSTIARGGYFVLSGYARASHVSSRHVRLTGTFCAQAHPSRLAPVWRGTTRYTFWRACAGGQVPCACACALPVWLGTIRDTLEAPLSHARFKRYSVYSRRVPWPRAYDTGYSLSASWPCARLLATVGALSRPARPTGGECALSRGVGALSRPLGGGVRTL